MLVYLAESAVHAVEASGRFRSARVGAAKRCFKARAAPAAILRWRSFRRTTRGKTLTEVAAAMWNHAPIMAKAGATPTNFAPDEMRDLLGYLLGAAVLRGCGHRGGRAAGVRRPSAARLSRRAPRAERPKLAGAGFNGATMVSALWRHGPSMLNQMKKQGVAVAAVRGFADGGSDRIPEHEEMMHERRSNTKRPILVLLASHWISMLGAALVTLAGFSWLFLLPTNIRGHVENPYIGLLLFIAIPIVFFRGPGADPDRHRLSRSANRGQHRRCAGPQGGMAARGNLLRGHDRGECNHRKPVQLIARWSTWTPSSSAGRAAT